MYPRCLTGRKQEGGRVIERTVEGEERWQVRWKVFLFYFMLDKYRKLVAVAEDMAAEWHECEMSVEGIQVSVELNVGIIRIGMMREYAVYCPDENQYEPSYAMDYTDTYFDWVDGDWVKRVPEVVEYKRPHLEYNPFEYIDELPF
jgi:hypothetical protein